MKKHFYLFLLLFFACFLVACHEQEEINRDEYNDYPVEEKYVPYYLEVIEQFENELNDGKITKSIELSYDILYSDGIEGYVSWESKDEKYLTSEGKYKLNTFDKVVTLHATVVNGSEYFEFDYDVIVKGFISKEDYLNQIYNLIPDNIMTSITFPTEESEILFSRGLKATISCKSLDETILTSDGVYKIDGSIDKKIDIEVTVTVDGETLVGSCTKLVCGRHDQEHVEHAIDWLNENFKANQNATTDLDLPQTDDVGLVSFTYESSNQSIFNNFGEMVNFIADTTVEFKVTATMNDYVEYAYINAKTLDRKEMISYIMDRMHKDTIQQIYLKTYITSSKGTNFDDYGFLNFYTKDVSESDLILSGTTTENYVYGENSSNPNVASKAVLKGIVPVESVNRPNMTKTSVEFITIHDTGDNYYSAEGWAGQIMTDSRQVSWHFTIDDQDIYQHLPLTEVAWHAGDGSNKFKLTDTGVKYQGKNPTLEFRSSDNHLYINGEKSVLLAPKDSDGNYKYAITPAGLYTTLGENGNYWINTYYYNKGYNLIGTGGGNYNSIGIETCVKDNTRYSETMRTCANLVAHMLKMYGLDISRVLQHRNYSGKMCPQSMIKMGVYDEFIEWINCELFILYNLNGATFTYTSNNPELVDNNGLINKYVDKATKVSYTVKVEYEDLSFEKTYETTILPLAN